MQQPAENKMGIMPIPKLIVNMSLPMIISMLVQALYNIVDSIYVGRIQEPELIFEGVKIAQPSLNAVSLAFPAQNLLIGVATGTAVGVNALLSRALGQKDQKLANQIAEHGVFLALVGYVLFLLFGLLGVRFFFSAQTRVPEIINHGVEYLSVVCCFSFGVFGQIMFERLMQSTGRTIYTMFTQGIGAIINIILDPIFIFTLNLGVKGAAIATVIGQIIAFVLAVILNHLKNDDVQLNFRQFRPRLSIVGRIYAIGVPSIIMVAIGSVMSFCMNRILIGLHSGKENAATVFGLYFKLNSFVFMPVFGLNNGIIPIVAFNYGARNRSRMMEAVKFSLVLITGYMLLGFLIFLIIPGPLLTLFVTERESLDILLKIGEPALRIIASSFTLAGICIALGSTFQALGYGIYSMIVSIARQLLVLVPAAWILARIGSNCGNDEMVWWSYPIAEIASLLVTLYLFSRLYKKVIKPLPLHGE